MKQSCKHLAAHNSFYLSRVSCTAGSSCCQEKTSLNLLANKMPVFAKKKTTEFILDYKTLFEIKLPVSRLKD